MKGEADPKKVINRRYSPLLNADYDGVPSRVLGNRRSCPYKGMMLDESFFVVGDCDSPCPRCSFTHLIFFSVLCVTKYMLKFFKLNVNEKNKFEGRRQFPRVAWGLSVPHSHLPSFIFLNITIEEVDNA